MIDLKFFWEKETFKTLSEELIKLKENNELLENSFIFLFEKINFYKTTRKLENYEIEIIKSQIIRHKTLKQKYDYFKKNQKNITSKTKKYLEKLYNSNSQDNISQDDLNEINWVTKKEKNKLLDTYTNYSPRDIIEDNIEIIWWNQWIIESQETSILLNQLTISFLDTIWKVKINEKKYFNLTEKEINLILKKLIKKLIKIKTIFFPIIKFKNNWKIKEYNLNQIKKQIEKEEKDSYKIEIFNKITNNNLNNSDILFLNKYLRIKLNNNTLNKKNIDLIKNYLLNNEDINIELIYIYSEILLKEWLIEKNTILNKIEKRRDFIYNDFLKRFWLPKNLEIIFKDLVEKYLTWEIVTIEWKKYKFTEKFIKSNTDDFIKKINIFIQFLLSIESEWWKVFARNKVSSAKKSFQFIDWYNNITWKAVTNKKWLKIYTREKGKEKFSPFETALRRSCLFFTGYKYPDFESNKCPIFIKNAWNKNNKNWLLDLSIEEESIIWMIDLFMRKWNAIKKIWWVLLWNNWSMRRLYEDYHHTTSKKNFTNTATEKKIDKIMSSIASYWKIGK